MVVNVLVVNNVQHRLFEFLSGGGVWVMWSRTGGVKAYFKPKMKTPDSVGSLSIAWSLSNSNPAFRSGKVAILHTS